MRILEQFIQRSEQFSVTECFLTCSWRFLTSIKLEQSYFKLEKIIGTEKQAGKVRKKTYDLNLQSDLGVYLLRIIIFCVF